MSISLYQSQVDRLTREIADLRGKLADENGKAVDFRGKAMRAGEAMTRASSVSMAQSKAREIERHEKSAVTHEKRAVQLERQIATKGSSLTTARGNLTRVTRQQQQKDDREAQQRRQSELAHIRELERQRRAAIALPESLHPRPPAPRTPRTTVTVPEFDEQYDVCLSFAGEQRAYVELVAQGLKDAGLQVFYDQDDDIAARLWGRELPEYLDYVYRQASRVCVMFISADYAAKEWTRLERRSALDRAVRETGEYVLPVRFDDTELPGLRPSVAYLDVRSIAPATLVEFVVRKLSEDGS